MRSPAQSPNPNPPPDAIAGLRASLLTALTRCRQSTLNRLVGLDAAAICAQPHPDFSPIGWHLGHIAMVEAQWILQHCAHQANTHDLDRRLFAADGLPKRDRVHLPPLDHLLASLAAVRSRVLAYAAIAPLAEQQRLWWWLVQHESQHAETISIVLALQGIRPPYDTASPAPALSPPADLGTQFYVPAGPITLGNDTLSAALDNERPRQTVMVPAYWLDRYPVTWGQYRDFIAAGGYDQPAWWTPAGWAWRQVAQVQHPLYQPPPEWGDRANAYPVCGVSWYEADAYARWRGLRLPTEAEWEKAACWLPASRSPQPYPWGTTPLTGEATEATWANHGHHVGQLTPVQAHPAGCSPLGAWDLVGNVWEWTSSQFQGYPGFVPFPYTGYSQAYFSDPHYVLRGGSWVTPPWALRPTFRNWYHPHVRQMFAGFRCARSGDCEAESHP